VAIRAEGIHEKRSSKQFDVLLRSSPAFRQKRVESECGLKTDAQLRKLGPFVPEISLDAGA
jgi:hypothetical protein